MTRQQREIQRRLNELHAARARAISTARSQCYMEPSAWMCAMDNALNELLTADRILIIEQTRIRPIGEYFV